MVVEVKVEELMVVKKMTHKIVIGDNVSAPSRKHLHAVQDKHSCVFDGDMKQGYNGCSGNFDVDFEWINGIPPPPHKGAVPNYCNHQDMQVLQSKIDYLEKQGIVKRKSDLDINVRYASPCML